MYKLYCVVVLFLFLKFLLSLGNPFGRNPVGFHCWPKGGELAYVR